MYYYLPIQDVLAQVSTTEHLQTLWQRASWYALQTQSTQPTIMQPDALLQLWYMTIQHSPMSPYLCGVFQNTFAINEGNPMVYFQALHLIEPRLNAVSLADSLPSSWENLGVRFEKDFLLKDLPLTVGEFWEQLLEPQRPMTSIVPNIPPPLQQAVDYAVEFPYPIRDTCGIVIEIDGELHNLPQQQRIDQQRAAYLHQHHWQVLRIKTEDFNMVHRLLDSLAQLRQEDYFSRLAQNYQQSLTHTTEGLEALQLVLSPLAIYRVQQSLLECMLKGQLQLKAPTWRIAVIEQDVPCAYHALEDLKQQAQQLFALEQRGRQLPEIHLSVITTRKYEAAKLNKNVPKQFSADFQPSIPFDVVIDVAMLQRVGQNWLGTVPIPCQTKLTIRSVFHAQQQNPVATFSIYFSQFLGWTTAQYLPTVQWLATSLPASPDELFEALPVFSPHTFFHIYWEAFESTPTPLLFANQCWVALAKTSHPVWRLLCVATLLRDFEHQNHLLGTTTLVQRLHQELAKGLYDLRYKHQHEFKSFSQTLYAKLQSVMSTKAQNIFQPIFEEVMQQLAAQPHLEWLKEFVQRFVK